METAQPLRPPLFFPLPMVDERRDASRVILIPDSEFAAVWRDGEEPRVLEVHDESLGGLGVIFAAAVEVALGMEFQVVYTSNRFRATVRHVHRLADGRQLIGLACERPG